MLQPITEKAHYVRFRSEERGKAAGRSGAGLLDVNPNEERVLGCIIARVVLELGRDRVAESGQPFGDVDPHDLVEQLTLYGRMQMRNSNAWKKGNFETWTIKFHVAPHEMTAVEVYCKNEECTDIIPDNEMRRRRIVHVKRPPPAQKNSFLIFI